MRFQSQKDFGIDTFTHLRENCQRDAGHNKEEAEEQKLEGDVSGDLASILFSLTQARPSDFLLVQELPDDGNTTGHHPCRGYQ